MGKGVVEREKGKEVEKGRLKRPVARVHLTVREQAIDGGAINVRAFERNYSVLVGNAVTNTGEKRSRATFGNSSLSYCPRKPLERIGEIVGGDPLILVGSVIHSNGGGVCFDCWQLERKGEEGRKVECKRTIKVSDKGISEIGGGM